MGGTVDDLVPTAPILHALRAGCPRVPCSQCTSPVPIFAVRCHLCQVRHMRVARLREMPAPRLYEARARVCVCQMRRSAELFFAEKHFELYRASASRPRTSFASACEDAARRCGWRSLTHVRQEVAAMRGYRTPSPAAEGAAEGAAAAVSEAAEGAAAEAVAASEEAVAGIATVVEDERCPMCDRHFGGPLRRTRHLARLARFGTCQY